MTADHSEGEAQHLYVRAVTPVGDRPKDGGWNGSLRHHDPGASEPGNILCWRIIANALTETDYWWNTIFAECSRLRTSPD
jgi:hypothetical protein